LSSGIARVEFGIGRLVQSGSTELQQFEVFEGMTTESRISRQARNSLKLLGDMAGAIYLSQSLRIRHPVCDCSDSPRNVNRAVSNFKDRSYRVVFGSVYSLCLLHSEFTPRPIFNAKRGIYTRNGSEAVPMERQPSPGWVSTPLGAVLDESLGWLGSGINLPGVVWRGGRGPGSRNSPDRRSS
jgi:hypothetical protein